MFYKIKKYTAVKNYYSICFDFLSYPLSFILCNIYIFVVVVVHVASPLFRMLQALSVNVGLEVFLCLTKFQIWALYTKI